MSRRGAFLGSAAPVNELAQSAQAYTGRPMRDYSNVVMDPRVQQSIGRAYDALPEHSEEAIPAYRQYAEEIGKQFDHLTSHGLQVEVTHHDPYTSPAEMMRDVRENNRLQVLSSAATGGHPFLSNDQNDMFRAVHDAYGHAATGRGFDRHGEEAAYRAHAEMFSPLARQALATETRGQNAAFIAHGEFQPQKVAILPRQFTGTGLAGRPTADVVQQARQFNAQQGLHPL